MADKARHSDSEGEFESAESDSEASSPLQNTVSVLSAVYLYHGLL